MISFLKDIFKELIVNLMTTIILSLLTIYGAKFYESTYEVNIEPKYIMEVIALIVVFAIINLYRVSRIKKIDRIQEPFPIIHSIKQPDLVQEIKNKQVLYTIDIKVINNHFHNRFENREPSYSVLDVDGPFCPECEIRLKERRTLFGNYKHFCSQDHVKFKNKFNGYSMTRHIKADYSKKIREKG